MLQNKSAWVWVKNKTAMSGSRSFVPPGITGIIVAGKVSHNFHSPKNFYLCQAEAITTKRAVPAAAPATKATSPWKVRATMPNRTTAASKPAANPHRRSLKNRISRPTGIPRRKNSGHLQPCSCTKRSNHKTACQKGCNNSRKPAFGCCFLLCSACVPPVQKWGGEPPNPGANQRPGTYLVAAGVRRYWPGKRKRKNQYLIPNDKCPLPPCVL